MALVPTIISAYTTTTDTAFAAVRGSLYVEQVSNAQRSIVSSSASDDSAGTGARTIRLTYFDETLAGPFTEDLIMDGTTPVNTAGSNICFIASIVVLTVGSALANVDTISLKAATGGGGVTIGSINPGDNRTQWGHHYVGLNKTASILELNGLLKGIANGELHLRKSTPTVTNTPELNIAPVLGLPPGVPQKLPFEVPLVVFGPARLTLYAKSVLAVSQDWLVGLALNES